MTNCIGGLQSVNSHERMIEIYQQAIDGYKHQWWDNMAREWKVKSSDLDFYGHREYRRMPESLDDFIDRQRRVSCSWDEDVRAAAKWAWANPESEDL